MTLPLGAFTTGAHALALPQPAVSKVRVGEWRALVGEHGGVVHVLYAACKCSGRIVTSLVARRALPNVREVVMVVGQFPVQEAALERAGFEVRHTDREALEKRYRIEAAPLFVVVGDNETVLYAGGYRASEGGPIEDTKIISSALGGQPSRALPLFGCAVSKFLRSAVDPLGLKD